jgi:hypothetical protein
MEKSEAEKKFQDAVKQWKEWVESKPPAPPIYTHYASGGPLPPLTSPEYFPPTHEVSGELSFITPSWRPTPFVPPSSSFPDYAASRRDAGDAPPSAYHYSSPYTTYSGSSASVSLSSASPLLERLTHPSYIQWEGRPAFEGPVRLGFIRSVSSTLTALSLDGVPFSVERVLSDALPGERDLRQYRVVISRGEGVLWRLSFLVSTAIASMVELQPVVLVVSAFGPYLTTFEVLSDLDRSHP